VKTMKTMNATKTQRMSAMAVIIASCTAFLFLFMTTPVFSDDSAKPPEEQPKIIQMTVTPKAAPEPALKYHLVVPLLDRKQGNAALIYSLARDAMLRGEEPEGAKKQAAEQRAAEQINKYLEMPLNQLPKKEVEEFLLVYQSTLQQVERGAMQAQATWDFDWSDPINALLPPLSEYRKMAKLLAVRARLEIARGQLDEAIHTIQTGLTFGRHMPSNILIGTLVGVGIQSLMLEQAQELINHGGPNLYWALAELKPDLVSMRDGIEFERTWWTTSLPGHRHVITGTMNSSEASALLHTIIKVWDLGGGGPSLNGPLAELFYSTRFYDVGKKILIENGRMPEDVEALPVAQVTSAALLADYYHRRDEMHKWNYVPYAQARQGMKRAEMNAGKARQAGFNPLVSILPSLGKAYFTEAKLERWWAALQIIESIRAYAASNGQLPKTLADLELPISNDPVTGEPFAYLVEGEKFVLEGLMPKDESQKDGVRYEVQVMFTAPSTEATSKPTKAADGTVNEATHEAAVTHLSAINSWQGIEPFISNETLMVARFDLVALTSDAAIANFKSIVKELLKERMPELIEKTEQSLDMLRHEWQPFIEAGASELYVMFDIDKLPFPFIIAPVKEGVDADKVASWLKSSFPSKEHDIQRMGGAWVLAEPWQIQQLSTSNVSEKNPRLMKAMESSSTAVHVAIALSDSVNRAITETIAPWLPKDMAGSVITRGLQWATIDFAVEPELELRATIQSADAAAAQEMSKLIELVLKQFIEAVVKADDLMLKRLIQADQPAPADQGFFALFVKAMKIYLLPTVDGDQLTLRLTNEKAVSILRLATPSFTKARTLAKRTASLANTSGMFKAMVMWSSKHNGKFPPDLQTLIDAGLMVEQQLVSPTHPELGKNGYVYVWPSSGDNTKDPASHIIMYESHLPSNEDVGALFADGHAEWMSMEKFKKLLEKTIAANAAYEASTKPASQSGK